MKEREFLNWILDVARRYGWQGWHVPAPMRAVGGGRFVPEPRAAGLPDLILLHHDPPRLIFAEAKVDTPLSDKQREFLRLARAVADLVRPADGSRPPVAAYVWRYGMEESIEATLRGRVLA